MSKPLHAKVDEIHCRVQRPINFLTQLFTSQVIFSQQTTSPPEEQQYWKVIVNSMKPPSSGESRRPPGYFRVPQGGCNPIPYVPEKIMQIKGRYWLQSCCKAATKVFHLCKTCKTHNPGKPPMSQG